MPNIRISFLKVNGVTPDQMRTDNIKSGYKYCSNHIIIYNKIYEKFTRKALSVANGRKKDAPDTITYLSVVSR